MRLRNSVRAAMNDAMVDQVDAGTGSGKVQIRTGNAAAAITDAAAGTLLVEFDLPEPAFGASLNGVATAAEIPDEEGLAAGTAGHYRVLDGNGAAVWDANYATGGLVLNTTTISVGVAVAITEWTVTQPAGAL